MGATNRKEAGDLSSTTFVSPEELNTQPEVPSGLGVGNREGDRACCGPSVEAVDVCSIM